MDVRIDWHMSNNCYELIDELHRGVSGLQKAVSGFTFLRRDMQLATWPSITIGIKRSRNATFV